MRMAIAQNLGLENDRHMCNFLIRASAERGICCRVFDSTRNKGSEAQALIAIFRGILSVR